MDKGRSFKIELHISTVSTPAVGKSGTTWGML